MIVFSISLQVMVQGLVPWFFYTAMSSLALAAGLTFTPAILGKKFWTKNVKRLLVSTVASALAALSIIESLLYLVSHAAALEIFFLVFPSVLANFGVVTFLRIFQFRVAEPKKKQKADPAAAATICAFAGGVSVIFGAVSRAAAES